MKGNVMTRIIEEVEEVEEIIVDLRVAIGFIHQARQLRIDNEALSNCLNTSEGNIEIAIARLETLTAPAPRRNDKDATDRR